MESFKVVPDNKIIKICSFLKMSKVRKIKFMGKSSPLKQLQTKKTAFLGKKYIGSNISWPYLIL